MYGYDEAMASFLLMIEIMPSILILRQPEPRHRSFLASMSVPSKYDVEVNVLGGGIAAQADAVKLGIARALLETNPDIRPLYCVNMVLLSVILVLKSVKNMAKKRRVVNSNLLSVNCG